MLRLARFCVTVPIGLIIVAVAGCEKPRTAATLPPLVVTVSQPVRQMIADSIEYTGYTAALDSIDIRAQVRGYLQNTFFKPRQRVRKGDRLFQIDPRPYQATVNKCKAELEVTEAQYKLAEAKLARMEEALKSNSISEIQVIEQRAARDVAKADIDKAKAALESAQLDLDYTSIIAPLDGRMSRDLPGLGTLIEPGATLMATLVNDDVVYAYCDLSEADVLRLRGQRASAATMPVEPTGRFKVYLGLAGETGYPHEGVIDYWAPQLDRSTGTIEVRAKFDNTNNALVAGLFARIRIPTSQPRSALLVAERALGTDQGQRFVFVVNDSNKVVYRRVKVGQLINGLRVIQEGVSPEDWVIVGGLQRVRPDVTVSTQKAAMSDHTGVTTKSAS